MTQQQINNRFDNWMKIVTSLLPILGFLWGIYQFNIQQNTNAAEEFDRRMFSNTLESYSKMTQIVGTITTMQLPRDSLKYDSLQTDFNKMYWGSLLLVEEEDVRKALRGLKGEINDVRKGDGTVENIALRQDYLAEQFRIALRKYREPE